MVRQFSAIFPRKIHIGGCYTLGWVGWLVGLVVGGQFIGVVVGRFVGTGRDVGLSVTGVNVGMFVAESWKRQQIVRDLDRNPEIFFTFLCVSEAKLKLVLSSPKMTCSYIQKERTLDKIQRHIAPKTQKGYCNKHVGDSVGLGVGCCVGCFVEGDCVGFFVGL